MSGPLSCLRAENRLQRGESRIWEKRGPPRPGRQTETPEEKRKGKKEEKGKAARPPADRRSFGDTRGAFSKTHRRRAPREAPRHAASAEDAPQDQDGGAARVDSPRAENEAENEAILPTPTEPAWKTPREGAKDQARAAPRRAASAFTPVCLLAASLAR